MDNQEKRRKSKFSFSRAPVQDESSQQTLQQFKNRFKGTILH